MNSREILKRLRETIERAQDGNRCTKCGMAVNPLLHILNPYSCPATPPWGGNREPHKDEL